MIEVKNITIQIQGTKPDDFDMTPIKTKLQALKTAHPTFKIQVQVVQAEEVM